VGEIPANRIIPVEACRSARAYPTVEAAIEAAKRHPHFRQAEADTATHAGAILQDAWWTDEEFWILFADKSVMHLQAVDREVRWDLAVLRNDGKKGESIGSCPVTYQWPRGIGERVEDRSELIKQRLGCALEKIFVGDLGVWVYFPHLGTRRGRQRTRLR